MNSFYLLFWEDIYDEYDLLLISESCANFVLEDKANGRGMVVDKWRFFFEYPEFIRMRSYIRKRLDLK